MAHRNTMTPNTDGLPMDVSLNQSQFDCGKNRPLPPNSRQVLAAPAAPAAPGYPLAALAPVRPENLMSAIAEWIL